MTPPTATPADTSPYAALPALPTPVPLASSPLQISLTPLKLGEIPAMAAALAPMTAAIQGIKDAAQPDWFALIAQHGAHLIKALSVATRQPEPDLMDLDLADSVTLIEAVIACNADFFTRQVLPKIASASSRLNTRNNNWQTPSPTSSVPATATPTSLATP